MKNGNDTPSNTALNRNKSKINTRSSIRNENQSLSPINSKNLVHKMNKNNTKNVFSKINNNNNNTFDLKKIDLNKSNINDNLNNTTINIENNHQRKSQNRKTVIDVNKSRDLSNNRLTSNLLSKKYFNYRLCAKES